MLIARHVKINPSNLSRGSSSTILSSCSSEQLVLLAIRGAIIVMATRGSKRKSIGSSGNSQKQSRATEPVVCPITAQLTEWFRGNALCQSFILFQLNFPVFGFVCLQMGWSPRYRKEVVPCGGVDKFLRKTFKDEANWERFILLNPDCLWISSLFLLDDVNTLQQAKLLEWARWMDEKFPAETSCPACIKV